ncbi:MAG: 5-bromo-4-chloroindolyl phosphate hydrolysis family protein [Peptococcaceae bacterium]|nr:5-bromo-4-chloroindolyl phosphate hydrolysis family protein [Peptococcaceae bacterium]
MVAESEKIFDKKTADRDKLEAGVIPQGYTRIEGAFDGRDDLLHVAIPDGVKVIGESAFRGCGSLIDIVIPYGVTTIGRYAFKDCASLAAITIPGSVATIDSFAFEGCSSLEEIILPDSVEFIGQGTFQWCKSLRNIILSNHIAKIPEWVFRGCVSLENIVIPESVNSIPPRAFDRSVQSTLTVYCYKKESIYKYCIQNGIRVKITEDGVIPAGAAPSEEDQPAKKKSAAPKWASYGLAAVCCLIYLLVFSSGKLINIVIAIVIGVAVYLISKNLFAARKDDREDVAVTPEQNLLEEIHAIGLKIGRAELTARITELEDICRQMFAEVERYPQKVVVIRRSLEYHLPVVLKLLVTYHDMENQKIQGETIRATLEKIEKIMDAVLEAFRNQLDGLYKDQALDISTDITVLQGMLTEEGLLDDGLTALRRNQ